MKKVSDERMTICQTRSSNGELGPNRNRFEATVGKAVTVTKPATGGCDRCRSLASRGFVGWWVVILRQYVIHRFHRRKNHRYDHQKPDVDE
ncbi:hypothetical protein Hanom_Chr03g00232791 [Helianthus anomalus]